MHTSFISIIIISWSFEESSEHKLACIAVGLTQWSSDLEFTRGDLKLL